MRGSRREYLWIVVERHTAELAGTGFRMLLSYTAFDVQFPPVARGYVTFHAGDRIVAEMLVFAL